MKNGSIGARSISGSPVHTTERARWYAWLDERCWRNSMKPAPSCQQKFSLEDRPWIVGTLPPLAVSQGSVAGATRERLQSLLVSMQGSGVS